MKKYFASLVVLLVFTLSTSAQKFIDEAYVSYDSFKEPSLDKRRIKHWQLTPLIKALKSTPKFEVNKIGTSLEGRDINLISLGKGDKDILLWSQMHGDEPTATQAIFDLLNFFASNEFKHEQKLILGNTRLHFIPMLNPDGAEVFQRRNALGVDINRDALRLQSPEGKILKRVRDSLDADFGFNLHDQSRYYNVERTSKPATISFLASAFNYEKEIDAPREQAMKTIVYMNDVLQKYAPGQVGRYNDDFEPRAFGDNIAKWGTSLILIESGGYANDREKQQIRKLNFIAMLSAFYGIANADYKEILAERYETIPHNDKKLFDLKITDLTYAIDGREYTIDLGINRYEVDNAYHDKFHYNSTIVDQGDLSTYYGYETFNGSGYTVVPPKVTEQVLESMPNVDQLVNYVKWVQSGFAYVKMNGIPLNKQHLGSRMHLASPTFQLPEFKLQVGKNPTFFLKKDGELTHAVINGFIVDLALPFASQYFGNALIYR